MASGRDQTLELLVKDAKGNEQTFLIPYRGGNNAPRIVSPEPGTVVEINVANELYQAKVLIEDLDGIKAITNANAAHQKDSCLARTVCVEGSNVCQTNTCLRDARNDTKISSSNAAVINGTAVSGLFWEFYLKTRAANIGDLWDVAGIAFRSFQKGHSSYASFVDAGMAYVGEKFGAGYVDIFEQIARSRGLLDSSTPPPPPPPPQQGLLDFEDSSDGADTTADSPNADAPKADEGGIGVAP